MGACVCVYECVCACVCESSWFDCLTEHSVNQWVTSLLNRQWVRQIWTPGKRTNALDCYNNWLNVSNFFLFLAVVSIRQSWQIITVTTFMRGLKTKKHYVGIRSLKSTNPNRTENVSVARRMRRLMQCSHCGAPSFTLTTECCLNADIKTWRHKKKNKKKTPGVLSDRWIGLQVTEGHLQNLGVSFEVSLLLFTLESDNFEPAMDLKSNDNEKTAAPAR